MKHRNYVKYSKMNKEENNEIVIDKPSYEEVIENDEVANEIKTNSDEIVNEENQNGESKQQDPILAVVTGCAKLRVRRAPSADAGIYGTINEGTELTVADEEAYDDFYKVYTVINETLIEGYCMKKFIKLK